MIGTIFLIVLSVVMAIVISVRLNREVAPVVDSNTKNGITWIINNEALDELGKAGASSSLLTSGFHNDRTYVVNNSVPSAFGVPTATYTSYQSIQSAIINGRLPGNYKAVIYDNESWQFTPLAEQQDPVHYEQLVGELLHQHGLLYIATPATDLIKVMDPNVAAGATFDAYIRKNIAADTARYADVYEIQAQGSETDIPKFSNFVTSAAAQARAANTNIKVLAGISTNPSGQVVTSDRLSAAFSAVRSSVDGYWLNIPSGGAYCPKCGTAQPSLAISLLQSIYGN